MFAPLVDHTYVECAGGVSWGCWGRKQGGVAITQGTGSTARASAIAEPNERAGITCYAINGVCHQAANRILFPAARLVNAARGYWLSDAMYGTYGRSFLGTPCQGTFNRHPGISGDLPSCVTPPPASGSSSKAHATDDASSTERSAGSMSGEETKRYIKEVVALYQRASRASFLQGSERVQLHAQLFDVRLRFCRTPRARRPLRKRTRDALLEIRRETEWRWMEANEAYGEGQISFTDLALRLDQETLRFQETCANSVDAESYWAVFELDPAERLGLCDPAIVQHASLDLGQEYTNNSSQVRTITMEGDVAESDEPEEV